MARRCVVSGCRSRRPKFRYFCLPFSNKTRWKQWLTACPFLRRYNPFQLEGLRFCSIHFVPEHINSRLRLTPNAVPLLNLNFMSSREYLEITPSNTGCNFKVIRPSLINNNTTSLPNQTDDKQTSRPVLACNDINNIDTTKTVAPLEIAPPLKKSEVLEKTMQVEVQQLQQDAPVHKNLIEKNTSTTRPADVIPTFIEDITSMIKSQDLHDPSPTELQEDTVVPEENNFSWQKPDEVVTIPEDDIETEVVMDDVSLYWGDALRPPTPDESPTPKGTPVPDAAFWCNVCSQPITGARYTCMQCSWWDACGACEPLHHTQHYVLRVPKHTNTAEVLTVLEIIRRHLLNKLDPIADPSQNCDDAISVKSEVKSENDVLDDSTKMQSQDDVDPVGSETSPPESTHAQSDDDSSTVIERCRDEELQKSPSAKEKPIMREDDTNTASELEIELSTKAALKRNNEYLSTTTSNNTFIMEMSEFQRLYKKPLIVVKTKGMERYSRIRRRQVLKSRINEGSEQVHITIGNVVQEPSPLELRRDKLARMHSHVERINQWLSSVASVPRDPMPQYTMPRCSVNLVRLPSEIHGNVELKRPEEAGTASAHDRNSRHQHNR